MKKNKTSKDIVEELGDEDDVDLSVDDIKAAAVEEYIAEQEAEDPEVEELGPCGHVNRHFYEGTVLTDLACTLLSGHEENHNATFTVTHLEAGEEKEEDKTEFWNDTAGKPAAEIKQDLTGMAEIQEARKKRGEEEYLAR